MKVFESKFSLKNRPINSQDKIYRSVWGANYVRKRLSMNNYDKRLSRKDKFILIWEEIFKLNSYLATFIWEGQKKTLYE